MVACSATEVVNEIVKLQRINQENDSLASVKARSISNDGVPGEGNTSITFYSNIIYT